MPNQTVGELRDLVVAYAKQETVAPLRDLGRFLLWGVIGTVLLSVGVVLGALAILRALQTEAAPHLDGDWSWLPYVGALLFLLAVAGTAASRIARRP